MGISLNNCKKIEACFQENFPKSKIKKYDRKIDGSFESMSVTVESIDRYALKALGKLIEEVGNSLTIKRSGTKVNISFW
ncbi:hypothetical protein QQ054_31970 [Oscillatoria amoena NRMC-F 0135]|nr:hypothetical protein [Oscillatoria amoena NRMC-F 0135]